MWFIDDIRRYFEGLHLNHVRGPRFTGQRSLERFVQRQLVAGLLDQEHGNAAAVQRQDDTVPFQQETLHTRPVRGVRPMERPGPVLARQQRPDQLQQHGRADQEPFDAGQSAGGRRVQRELSQLAATSGKTTSRVTFFFSPSTTLGALRRLIRHASSGKEVRQVVIKRDGGEQQGSDFLNVTLKKNLCITIFVFISRFCGSI